ncbi:MAG TPA: DinB family protein [Bacillales bacterium]|nr:DinB family protein [Bacillales bacterium]
MNDLTQAAAELLKETFQGATEQGSWYVTTEKNAGIFGTLEQLSAEQASISHGGATIAAHADHIRYYLEVARTYIRGKEHERDWGKSWKIDHVDESEWSKIQQALREEYEAMQADLQAGFWQDEYKTNVLAALAHSAYHLGALRQMIKPVS